eukprot:766388-Hanusia_phi.AAC.6
MRHLEVTGGDHDDSSCFLLLLQQPRAADHLVHKLALVLQHARVAAGGSAPAIRTSSPPRSEEAESPGLALLARKDDTQLVRHESPDLLQQLHAQTMKRLLVVACETSARTPILDLDLD